MNSETRPRRRRLRKDDVEPLARLSAEALAEEGATEEALAVAQLAFRQLRIPYHAYDAACFLAGLDRADEAVQWLERAVDAGLECRPDTLLADPAFAPLRARPDFRELALRAGGEQETA